MRPDPFVDHLETRVVESSPMRAVVEQPDVPILSNHVGVRHASALHAAGYEAARALAHAALAEQPLELESSEISYDYVGMGPLEFVAEPDGDWSGDRFPAKVSCTDGNGKTVAKLSVVWRAVPAERVS